MEKLKFAELGLSAEVLKAVDKMGFEEASPIQTAVIPLLLSGKDVVGQSATGSGKTAAFGIPAVEKVDAKKKAVQVLILCPTRELAVQVAEEIAKLAFFKTGVREVPIFGGQPYDRQIRALEGGAQIVIGTPGRVMDHMERGTLRLDNLKMIILDECDRMLDMGFRDDIEKILSETPATRQSLFFSATMPPAIQAMINRFLPNPEWVKIAALAQNAPKVDQVYFEVDRRYKIDVLTRLIDLHDFRYGIIFCSTKVMVDELDEHLHARGYATDRLHGDITQSTRTRVMDKFKRRGFEFLVATDVAARGLDVDDLEVVFNFDLPNDAEDYTHRVGRTGRAGREGKAFTFVAGRELYGLQNMIRYGKLKIRRENVPSLDQVEEARENVFFEKVRGVLEAAKFIKQDRFIDRLMEQGYPSTDVVSALLHMMHGGEKPDAAPAPAKAGVKAIATKPAAHTPAPAYVPEAPRPAPAAFAKVANKPKIAPPAAQEDRPAFQNAPHKQAEDAPVSVEPSEKEKALFENEEPAAVRPSKQKFQRAARTGREPNMTTLFFNVGRKQLITPADIVGKVAGVTRLPANVVGAMDIHQRHTLVDVTSEHVELIMQKMKGIRVKNIALEPALATDADRAAE
ncbi:DEAD/DEAH box helicase [Rariglobus hedericola]|uniref:DEAD-box ATP-dependent RNA helicase RhpA n=1 Tax=Rariglobus hedericola TaxID=2597822 RepID=A0A556QR45_9BACT|nr:DEAD/DEAH box helicase [Rariglobus hedericola]TSJ79117.1 DEAD/DEAH box helicase [Rariglobus hedericola]